MANQTEQNNVNDTIDIREILHALKQYLWVIILVTLITGIAGYVYSSFFITPKYESSVTMIVNTIHDDSKSVTNDNINSAKNLVPTYSIILKSNSVLNKVIDNLNLDMSYDELAHSIRVSSVDNTQVMKIAVTLPNKQLTADIAENIAIVSPDIIVDTVEAGSCKVISEVKTKYGPVSPNIKKNTTLSAILGFSAVAAIIILYTIFKEKKIVDENDIRTYLDLPVLGVIPEVEGGKK